VATDPVEGAAAAGRYELGVDPLPPAPPRGEGDRAGETPPGTPPAKPGKPELGADWTHDDLQVLVDWIRAPYEKIAMTTGDDWIELDDKEALSIAVPATMWMPVGWVRASGGRMSPVTGAIVTALTLAWVTAPRVARFVREHPEAGIELDLAPGIRAMAFWRRGKEASSDAAEPRPAASRPERDRGGDRGEGAAEPARGADAEGRRSLGIDPDDLR
jgi:hypothetical protein